MSADGGPAFPTDQEAMSYGFEGMSLRDWFAGQALAGFATTSGHFDPKKFAQTAYLLADAMLAAREAKP